MLRKSTPFKQNSEQSTLLLRKSTLFSQNSEKVHCLEKVHYYLPVLASLFCHNF